ncbi:signal peptidase I [Lachnospiraceae bacterium A10]|jgi:signal peptidase I|nr:signal peptidase I [Lachnospiraceae bacterium A10]
MSTEEMEVKNDSKSGLREIIRMVLYFAAILAITFCIIEFVGQRTVVSGSSMETTLSDGDNLIIDKLTYRFSDPQRFDIIVFPYQYEEDTYYIKRIIGLPGEKVRIDEEGNIYINDVLLEEDYGYETIKNPGIAASTITLGEDQYFVLGDNRNNSTDSRFENVGLIKRSDIIGRAVLRVFPFTDFTLLTNED